MIYYGDEVGMWGADDPTNRKPMLWKDLEPYEQPADNFVMEDHLTSIVGQSPCGTHPALRRGSIRTVLVDDEQDVWVFLREFDDDVLLVAINASGREARVPLPADPLPEGDWSLAFGAGRAESARRNWSCPHWPVASGHSSLESIAPLHPSPPCRCTVAPDLVAGAGRTR